MYKIHTHVHMRGGLPKLRPCLLQAAFQEGAGAGGSDSILDVSTESSQKHSFFSFLNIGQFLEMKVGLRFTR